MPTAAKLFAAMLFAALAWLASELAKPLFPEGMNVGRFSEWNAAIGAAVGWRVAGTRAGASWPNAVANGLTTAVGMGVLALFLHSLVRMLGQSYGRVYDGPMEALVDVVRLMAQDAHLLLNGPVLLSLVAGGILGGLATEWVARNYS